MNQVILIGNLTKDPETRYQTGQNQNAVCRFTLAVNEKKKNQQTGMWEDHPSYIPVVVFGKQAENCDRFLAKGRKVAIQGKIQTGSYINKDGQKVYTTDVIANGVEFVTPKNEQPQQPQAYAQQPPAQEQQTYTQEPAPQQQTSIQQNVPAGFEQMNEEIPF